MAANLLSPKQVARAIGVSESSLKRWCDRGAIATVKTAGGHRRIPLSGIVSFLRESGHPVVSPELLGLPPSAVGGGGSWQRGEAALTEALVQGDEKLARQIVFDAYLAGQSVTNIGDLLIQPALREIGRRWSCGDAEVFQERRACEMCHRILVEVRNVLPQPADDAPLAIGATPAADQYRLPTLLVELVLREAGWNAVSLGSNLPFDTLRAAIERYHPRLFWLSISYVEDVERFVSDYNQFFAGLSPRPAIALGGRALDEPLRQRLTYASFCDNLRQLAAFVESLEPAPGPRAAASGSTRDGGEAA